MLWVTQRKVLESDTFRVLESERVAEIGALICTKFLPQSLLWSCFGLKKAKEKLQGTDIPYCFGNSEIWLNFCKRIGPIINGREPIFVTISLPEFISDQAVGLAFPKFGEVVSVFKGRHKFNRNIRNGKIHVRIFPTGGDQTILKRKIYFMLVS